MKLLFDQNLSPYLVEKLLDQYPNSSHVSSVGLGAAPDIKIWEYARANGFALVSKDADYSELSVLKGSPPSVIWIRLGNCTTREIERALLNNRERIYQFGQDEDQGILVID